MMYTGERIIPDGFSIDDRILVEHLDRYKFASTLIADHLARQDKKKRRIRILDAPCGVGYGAALLAEQNHADVVGMDKDQKTIDYARQRYGDIPELTFEVVDLDSDRLEIDEFDVAVCFEGIEHVKQQVVVARGLAQAVVRGGLVIVSTPRRGGPGAGSEFHTKELVRDELYDLFWPYVAAIKMYGQDLRVGDCGPDLNARYYVLVGIK